MRTRGRQRVIVTCHVVQLGSSERRPGTGPGLGSWGAESGECLLEQGLLLRRSSPERARPAPRSRRRRRPSWASMSPTRRGWGVKEMGAPASATGEHGTSPPCRTSGARRAFHALRERASRHCALGGGGGGPPRPRSPVTSPRAPPPRRCAGRQGDGLLRPQRVPCAELGRRAVSDPTPWRRAAAAARTWRARAPSASGGSCRRRPA